MVIVRKKKSVTESGFAPSLMDLAVDSDYSVFNKGAMISANGSTIDINVPVFRKSVTYGTSTVISGITYSDRSEKITFNIKSRSGLMKRIHATSNIVILDNGVVNITLRKK